VLPDCVILDVCDSYWRLDGPVCHYVVLTSVFARSSPALHRRHTPHCPRPQNDMAAAEKFFEEGGEANVSTIRHALLFFNHGAILQLNEWHGHEVTHKRELVCAHKQTQRASCKPGAQVRCRMQTIALHRAVFYGHLDMCKYLIGKGCDIEVSFS
jgi:hypothetical protein